MNIGLIQSIQIQQDIPRPRDNNASAEPASAPSPATSNAGQPVQGQLQGVMNNIGDMMQQLDPITVYDPPFFPICPPARMDWVNKLNNAQDEVAKVAVKIGDTGIHFKAQALNGNATDAEIVGTIRKLAHFRKEAAHLAPPAADNKKTGAYVSIKV
jgi:hypothetical protein